MNRQVWVVAVLAVLLASHTFAGPDDWTHLGRDASRQSIAVNGPNKLLQDPNQGCWIVSEDPCVPGSEIEFEGATGPVVYAGKVFAYAKCAGDPSRSQLVAWDAQSGQLLWSKPIDAAVSYSSSSPCVDAKHNSVLIGSGSSVFAFDADDGGPIWRSPTELDAPIVNASLCVASDLPHARAFITDNSFGTTDLQGHLYCINLDANEPDNPYEPGQILWRYHLGSTLGNSPSYLDGFVYVTTISGRIYALDATAASAPDNPVWIAPDSAPMEVAFYGGLTATRNVTAEGVKRFLYAATNDSAASENNSILVKIDCENGRIVWNTPVRVECTNTVPVIVGDMIFISAGAAYDQSKLKVQALRDLGDRAELVWDTSVDLPGPAVGGWSAQPTYAAGKLYVGAASPGTDWIVAYDRLYVFDVTRHPSDEGFVLDWTDGCGNSPAVTHDSVYSIGSNALMKFYQARALADIDGDGQVTDFDRQSLLATMGVGYPLGTMRADLDLDGDVDDGDLDILEADMTANQP